MFYKHLLSEWFQACFSQIILNLIEAALSLNPSMISVIQSIAFLSLALFGCPVAHRLPPSHSQVPGIVPVISSRATQYPIYPLLPVLGLVYWLQEN